MRHGDRPQPFCHRRPLAVALLLVLCGGLPSPAQDTSAITLSVRGLGGRAIKAKRRHFVALNVSLDNPTGQDSAGTLRAFRVRGSRGTTPQQGLFFERRVQLPRSGRRTETIYYYCQENEPSNQLCVSYEPDEGPRPDPSYPAFEVLDNDVQMLVLSSLSDSEAYWKGFGSAVLSAPRRVYASRVEVGDLSALPDHMAGYEAYDTILVAELDGGDLPAEKAAPLLDWVQAGGDLLVSSSGGRTALPDALKAVLPLAPASGSVRADRRTLTALRALAPAHSLPVATPVLVERVDALPGSAVLAGDAGGPLVIRGRFGAGTVTFTAFPLDSAPLRGWSGRTRFCANLLRVPREELGSEASTPAAPPLEELVYMLSEALESLDPPSRLLVAPLLLLYVALVSPVNFVLLSRLKRLRLAQVSAMAVVVGFGVLFFGIGFLYKGSDSLITQIGLLEIPARPGKSRVDVMTGFFATDRGFTRASSAPGSMVGPIANKNASREGRVIQHADGVRLEAVTLDTWAMRRFRSLRAEDLGQFDVALSLRGRSGKLSGTIANKTQLDLKGAMLLFNGSFLDLGRLDAGQALELSNSVTRTRLSDARERTTSVMKYLDEDLRGTHKIRYGKGFAASGEAYGGSSSARMFDTLQARLGRVPYAPGRVPALLVGHVVHDPQGVTIESSGRTMLTRSVVLCELQVALESGVHRLDGLTPRIVGTTKDMWQTSGDGRTGDPPLLKGAIANLTPETPGTVRWTWQLPTSPDQPLALETLRFRWKVSPRPVPKLQFLYGFSFRTRSWIPLQDMGLMRMDDNGYGRWPVEDVNPLVHDLVDPTSGILLVEMRNHGQNVTIQDMVLDAEFRN